jgi:predicted DNA-binding helix-hairpin-helix protein
MVRKTLTTAEAISALLAASDPGGLLSCQDAVNRIRMMTDRCELTDEELVELVVLEAMRRHVGTIAFDARGSTDELRPVAC